MHNLPRPDLQPTKELRDDLKRLSDIVKGVLNAWKEAFAELARKIAVHMNLPTPTVHSKKQRDLWFHVYRSKVNASPRAMETKPNRAKALTHHSRRHRHSELC